ncbi:MAG: ATP-binding protein [Erysipelotrichaceae bacterium]
MKKIEEIKRDFIELSLPIGLLICKADEKFSLIFANDMFVKMFGYDTMEELFEAYHHSAWNCVIPEDIERLKTSAIMRSGKFDAYEISYRAIKKDGSIIWVSQSSRHTLDEFGNEIVFAYYSDISKQKEMEASIYATSKKYETLVNSIPGGVGMYELDDALTPIFVSDGVYKLCGMSKEEYESATKNSTMDIFHPDDSLGVYQTIMDAYHEHRNFSYEHRICRKDGSYRWIKVSGQIITQNNRSVLYAVFTDVHEQIMAQEALRESEFRNSMAVNASHINIWEYNYSQDVMTIFSSSPRVKYNNIIIPNYLASVKEEEHIRKDCAPILSKMMDDLKNGATEVNADLWIRNQKDENFWCERVVYRNIFDEQGKPIKAYCVGQDVTKEKEAEKRYRDELSYREAMQKVTVASINVNLTKNTILDYKSIFPEISKHMKEAKSAQAYFDWVSTAITTVEMRKQFSQMINCEVLLQAFAVGKTSLSLELTRKIGGRRFFTIVSVHMMKQVENGDIVAFLYSTDVTNERMMKNVMDAIVKTDYDFLVVVDALRNTAVRYSENDLRHNYSQESENFEEETNKYIHKFVCKQDVERVANELTIQNILTHLNEDETYLIFYNVPDQNNRILSKQLRFSYINRELQSFLMTRTDITAAVQEQEKKNQELLLAVSMAEKANAAKSEFLSRISHEIRTPMNAIIGMSQIALQSLNDKQLAQTSIEKSLYASQYLLLLLNDILDMSRIESGKVVLKEELIDREKFLDAIKTIVGSQAETKGVHYQVTQFVDNDVYYLGDRVRLQQILINILSNAVKFTPKDGSVQLNISKISEKEDKVIICFEISDTGIGISKDFLPSLFQPFSQEHVGANSSYGGSGLGLAISKNLAELMGGEIKVESELGKGTTFRVILPFTISNKEKLIEEANISKDEINKYDFSGMRILLVEDHELNVMVATKLLEFKRATVEVANNGEDGLNMFKNSLDHYYDAILMDIRMPIMNGLEATKAIRAIDREWAKAIPIIAMSANAFDEDIIKSKKAGMNVHLGKPIEPELLYQTLYQVTHQERKK